MATTQEISERPLVLIHRFPTFALPSNPPFTERLLAHFRLFDPLNSPGPLELVLSRHPEPIRAVVTVGPTPISAEFLSLLPELKLVVATSAGVDRIDLPECRRRGIVVTNASTAFCEDVADCAVGLLVDVLRKVSAADRFVRSGLWPGDKFFIYPLGFKLGGKRIGIVGLGSIGADVAKRLSAFGCSIAYTSRSQKPSFPFPFYANIRDLAANSDVLVLCCSLTEQTRHIVDKDVMTALGKEGVIVNVGRGALIDEKEMVNFLVRGDLGGAGLDVFENEPDVPKELFGLDNVVLSRHCAAFTPEGFEALLELVISNLKALFMNQPFSSVVSNE